MSIDYSPVFGEAFLVVVDVEETILPVFQFTSTMSPLDITLKNTNGEKLSVSTLITQLPYASFSKVPETGVQPLPSTK